MDMNLGPRVANLRLKRKRARHCRDCDARLNPDNGIRCGSCQEKETLGQQQRRANRNEDRRVEVIIAVSEDIDYGVVLMLTNLALLDYTGPVRSLL